MPACARPLSLSICGHAGGRRFASLFRGRVLHLLKARCQRGKFRRRIDGKRGLDIIDPAAKTGLSGARASMSRRSCDIPACALVKVARHGRDLGPQRRLASSGLPDLVAGHGQQPAEGRRR